MKETRMPRKEAARMIDDIRKCLAGRMSAESIEKMLKQNFNVEPFRACTGEAHSNPHIDNCGVCAPRWEWVGDYIKVT